MLEYLFLAINHLGEPFWNCLAGFLDSEGAYAYAKALAERGFPVEVRLHDQILARIEPPAWRLDDWMTPHLGPWPLTDCSNSASPSPTASPPDSPSATLHRS